MKKLVIIIDENGENIGDCFLANDIKFLNDEKKAEEMDRPAMIFFHELIKAHNFQMHPGIILSALLEESKVTTLSDHEFALLCSHIGQAMVIGSDQIAMMIFRALSDNEGNPFQTIKNEAIIFFEETKEKAPEALEDEELAKAIITLLLTGMVLYVHDDPKNILMNALLGGADNDDDDDDSN